VTDSVDVFSAGFGVIGCNVKIVVGSFAEAVVDDFVTSVVYGIVGGDLLLSVFLRYLYCFDDNRYSFGWWS